MIQVGSKENERRANAIFSEKLYSEGQQKDVAGVFLFVLRQGKWCRELE